MGGTNGYTKNIVCLESFWNGNVEARLSVYPILQILERLKGTRSYILTCSTVSELKFNFEVIKQIRGFKVLYLCFHGYKGGIILPEMKVDIEAIGFMMGKRRFRDWIVYFGSCKTLNVSEDRIYEFISYTGVRMVVGFKNSVDFVAGTCLDLILFDFLQRYKDLRKCVKRFRQVHKGLADITGVRVYHKNP